MIEASGADGKISMFIGRRVQASSCLDTAW